MFKIKLAEKVFTIRNRHPYMENLCKDYLTDEVSNADIYITDEDIAFENQIYGENSVNYLESLAGFRKICEYLLEYDILLFHASALSLDGKAYIFTAPSGTGKSTHARLWRERFEDRIVVINDDKPILSFKKSGIDVLGTPYGGKHNLQNNISAPLSGIVILHQASENSIRRMTSSEAFPMLLNSAYRKRDVKGMIKTMDLVKRLSELPVYSLGCTISQDAVTLAYQTLTEKED